MLVSSVVPLSVEAKSARSSRQSETTGGAGISRTTRTPPEDPDRVLLSATPAVVPKVMPLIVVAALLLVGGFAAPFLLVGTVVCVVGIVFLALTQRFTVLTITSERTTLTTGILGRSTSEVWHRDIRNIQTTQSLTDRLFGVGTVGISSAGQSDVEVIIQGIANPKQTKELLDRLKRDAGSAS